MTIGGGDGIGAAERGFVSDTASGALVAADGTVDWWCPQRFDAPPLLTRLLDPAGACIRVGPWAPGRPPLGSQSYRDQTLILVTRLAGPESLVEVEDLLPWGDGAPRGRIIRRVTVLRGPVDVAVEIVPSGDPRDVSVWSEGMAFSGVVVRCGLEFNLTAAPPPAPARRRRRLVGSAVARLDTGEGLVVTLDPTGARAEPLSVDAAARLAGRTATAWRRYLAGAELSGPAAASGWPSLLVLKGLTGAEGAPVSAPVTSLPKVVGGERNADGRVVSPVTAASWALVSASLGLGEEAEAATRWIASALDHEPPLPSALAPDAGAPPTEAHLTQLSGWRGSQPVVAGTNAPDRISIEPVSAVVAAGADLTDRAAGADILAHWDRVVVHADWLADHWDRPEASVWDLGGPRRDWVAPRLAARRALSLAAASARRRNPLDLDAAGWQVAARQVERWLASKGVDAGGVLRPFAAADGGSAAGLDGGSFRPGGTGAGAEAGAGWTGSLAGGSDAALVRVAAWGPWPPDDVVVRNTIDRIIERNGDGPWIRPWPADLDDGRAGTEPASVTATLWVIRALALARRWEEAQERLDAVLTLAGPLGLLAESVDATTGDALGNRPSAAAHLALIEAALALGRSPA